MRQLSIFDYDENGNLIEDKQLSIFDYDENGNLKR